jgi:cellulose biosynthesis protein BcsQ
MRFGGRVVGVVSLVDLWDALVGFLGKQLAQLLAAVIILLVAELMRRLWKLVRSAIAYYRRLDRARRAVARDCTPAGPIEGKGLWISDQPIKPPKSYDYATAIAASKILVVANAKGGVGKTTVCANLGARFSQILEKPVLMIDLDFQGSLSSMSIVGQENWLPPQNLNSEATYLVSGDRSANSVASVGRHATGAESLRIIPSYYDLAQAENRTMVEWLIGDHKADLRFRLAEILHSNAVRETYSLVLIDCPPRLTTGAIQSLAAGTHVLIPTRLEEPSTEAVSTFVQQVEAFRDAGLCPHIRYVGVAPTMVTAQASTGGVKQRLRDALANSGAMVRLLDSEVPQSTRFRESEGITYLTLGNAQNVQTLKTAIEDLATVVQEAMGYEEQRVRRDPDRP